MNQYKKIKKTGWNWYACLLNIFWYYKYGIWDKAIIMTILIIVSLGIGWIPVAIYCGYKGNQHRYQQLKKQILI